jgi:HEAT repeat protein
LEALAALGDRESIPTIIKLLDDPDPEVCSAACRALGTLGARVAIPALENQLEAGKMRSEAIMALAALGAKDSARIIFRHLGDLPWANSVVPEALGVLEARELIPELRPLLKHRYALIRSEAAVALGELGDREATADLLALLEDPHSFVRAGAADALGRLQAREAIPILRRMLREPSEDLGSGGPPTEVVDALLRLQAREAIPELLIQVKRTRVSTLLPSLEALQQFGDSSTVPQLVSLLASKEAPFRSEDETLLVEDRGRIPAIVACTGFGGLVDTFQTYSIPEILANLDAREYLPDIEKLLGLGSTDTRMAAAQALCRLGSTRGVPIILSEAANGHPRGLFSLNALRRPLLWARMKGMRFPKTRDLTRRQVLETLAKTLGLRLEWVDRSWRSLSRPPCTRSSIRRFEDRSTLLEVAADEDFWIRSDLTLILEDDQIRVLWSDQAAPFWTQWWSAQQKK